MVQPSKNTLMQMFGTDEPIGSFWMDEYEDSLQKATCSNDVVGSICDFASHYHQALADYEDISPYGGFDITVLSVEEIAMGEAAKQINHPSIRGIEGRELSRLVYQELKVRGVDTAKIDGVIQDYESYAKAASGDFSALDKPFDTYRNELEAAVNSVNMEAEKQYFSERENGKALYEEAKHRLEKLNSKGLGLYKYFFRGKYCAEKNEVQNQISYAEDCMNVNGISLSEFKNIFYNSQYEEAKAEISPPYFPPEDRHFESEEDFLKFSIECQKKIENPNYRTEYLENCYVAGKTPVTFSANMRTQEPRLKNERPSVLAQIEELKQQTNSTEPMERDVENELSR